MGRRAAVEVPAALLAAFLRKRSWLQHELARELDVGVRTVRKTLDSLVSCGVPFARREEGAHVAWRLPTRWLPEAVALTSEDAKLAVRLLSRLKASPARDSLIRTLLGPTAVLLARADAEEPAPSVLALLEDARAKKVPVRVRYASTTGGTSSEVVTRTLSVHCIAYGEHDRLVATQHGKPGLRTFRIDRVREVHLAEDVAQRACDPLALDRYLATSIDGFHGEGAEVRCVFTVSDPEARWVQGNLPMRATRAERMGEGIQIEVVTTAVEVLARFVVGLGAAASVQTGPLRDRVVELARGAVAAGRRAAAATGRGGPGTARASYRAPGRRSSISGSAE